MWKQRSPGIEAAIAAVLCTLLTQHLSSRRSELWSELVCWLILPALFKVTARSDPGSEKQTLPGGPEAETKPARWSAWIFATSVVISIYFKAEGGILKLCVSTRDMEEMIPKANKPQPALTPLLLVAQHEIVGDSEALAAGSARPWAALQSAWGAALIAVFST
ncbi:hypothetical protein IMZ48_23500, partial [Candidatus Bathyarchaeota archaeon]|nr:hypothetical protein [Candidatus Bathyarchaeota archaeon]